MHRVLFVVCAVMLGVLLTGCGEPKAPTGVKREPTDWQARIDAVHNLYAEKDIPKHLLTENPKKDGSEWDVNDIFTVLTHLQVKQGCQLDYVYHYDGMGGYPVLYTYPADETPFETESAYQKALSQGPAGKYTGVYTDCLQVEDSPEGYFDYVLFRLMANQFYLFWHTGYNDTRIVADTLALEALFKDAGLGASIPAGTRKQAQKLDLEPQITLDRDLVIVRVITFSAWQGFMRETWTINRSEPHAIDRKYDVLIPYNCGIMF
ncbi:MAG: hypothetical protein ACYC6L_07260 [Anaerolineae bacterium]